MTYHACTARNDPRTTHTSVQPHRLPSNLEPLPLPTTSHSRRMFCLIRRPSTRRTNSSLFVFYPARIASDSNQDESFSHTNDSSFFISTAVITIMSILSAVTTGLWSRFGDLHGRKIVFTLTILGSIAMFVFYHLRVSALTLPAMILGTSSLS